MLAWGETDRSTVDFNLSVRITSLWRHGLVDEHWINRICCHIVSVDAFHSGLIRSNFQHLSKFSTDYAACIRFVAPLVISYSRAEPCEHCCDSLTMLDEQSHFSAGCVRRTTAVGGTSP